jgi:hypothetical protein
MKRVIYEQAHDGEWFNPRHKKFKHMCCGCALVHVVDFKVDEQGNVWTRWREDKRATAAARRPFRFDGENDE